MVGRALQQPQPPPARAAAGASAAERRSLRTLTLSSAGRCIGAAALPLPPGCLTPDADRVAARLMMRDRLAALEFAVDLRIYGSTDLNTTSVQNSQNDKTAKSRVPTHTKSLTDPAVERGGTTLSDCLAWQDYRQPNVRRATRRGLGGGGSAPPRGRSRACRSVADIRNTTSTLKRERV